MKDFTPTKETISLHGLGFIQLQLPNNQRMHVWHPELPRRQCYDWSQIHNHRFGFESKVLKGIQKNVRVQMELCKEGSGTHSVISHNGPRSERGGRISYPVAECNIYRGNTEEIKPGDWYFIEPYEYHCTPNDGIVITLMTKLKEGSIHANSLCVKSRQFDYDFDRFQLSEDTLYDYVAAAFKS